MRSLFEDFLEVQDAGLRELLGQVDKKTLAISLKGASEDLKNHFYKCMSSRAVEMLKEDMDALGPLRSWGRVGRALNNPTECGASACS